MYATVRNPLEIISHFAIKMARASWTYCDAISLHALYIHVCILTVGEIPVDVKEVEDDDKTNIDTVTFQTRAKPSYLPTGDVLYQGNTEAMVS